VGYPKRFIILSSRLEAEVDRECIFTEFVDGVREWDIMGLCNLVPKDGDGSRDELRGASSDAEESGVIMLKSGGVIERRLEAERETCGL